tara:strand:+ start:258 stop:593 length:336 start_codon:yes stop_codon:yes gene_type:complete
MFEVVLPLYMICFALCVFVFMSNQALSRQIKDIGGSIQARLNEEVKVPESFMAELQDSLGDLVHDTISTMQPPNAADHVMGALAQMIQMHAMKKFGLDQPRLNTPDPENEA